MKKYLIIFQQAPFSNSFSLEGLELSLALAAFNQDVSLLFTDAGILQLLNNTNGELINKKNFTKTFAGLDLFDIKQVYLDQASLEKHNINPEYLPIKPQVLSSTGVNNLLQQHDIVLTV